MEPATMTNESVPVGPSYNSTHVLHVIATGQRRGAEIFASDLVRSLAELGTAQRVVLLRASKAGGDVAYEAPVNVLGVNGGASRAARMDFRTLRALRSAIRSFRPQVVQAHGGEPLKYSVPAAAGTGVPVVYRRIGSTDPWISNQLRLHVYRTLMRHTAHIVAVAEVIRRETAKIFGLPLERIVTIPNGVDSRRLNPQKERAQVRAELGIPESACAVISLGAVASEKDPAAQLKVAELLIRARPEARYIFVGDGPMLKWLRDAIGKHGLGDRVLLLGGRADVPDLLAASDVVLLASRTEGMPAGLIEAGMAGVPAVAFRIAGIPEVVEHGKTGLLAPDGDVGRLAGCALKLLDDPEARVAMGRAARAHCRARFDMPGIASRYLEVYRKAART